MSLIIVLVISIPIGIYAAIRQDTILDRILRSFAIILISIPNFVIAGIITFYVFIWWHYFTPLEFISIGKDPLGNLGMLIMPASGVRIPANRRYHAGHADDDAGNFAPGLYPHGLGQRT